MITAHHISKSFGPNRVLQDVTFSINRRERVGLIGQNGSGKTTLLRILAGDEQADSGHISLRPTDLRRGYLPQGFEPPPGTTINQALHDASGQTDILAKELSELANALASEPDRDDLHRTYDQILARLTVSQRPPAQPILDSLGLSALDPEQSVATLSGGQKTRLALARVLLQSPHLLLLDEPTNHLDIDMLQWLEGWLSQFEGAALIVSHDRRFLDAAVNRIIDLDHRTGTIREYQGHYSAYLEQYLARQEKFSAVYRTQQAEIARLKEDIARTKQQALRVEDTTTPRQPNVRRLAKKVAKKARSREKKLDRFLKSPDLVEKPGQGWQMKLDWGQADHLGSDVLVAEGLEVGYLPASPILSHLNFTILSGQRVVLTGPNGCGKSTLLRTLAGDITPLGGRYRTGPSIKMGYMSQEMELPEGATALRLVQQEVSLSETDARSFLHYFLFKDDDPLRYIEQLSYGERARLGLALLVARGSNFLLLDEPINHLDIPSRSRFEQALASFEGTILTVVHDRYFIDRFANQVWRITDGLLHQEIHRLL